MAISTSWIVLLMTLMLGFVVGGIFLQIFLSKRESKWPGLILPGIAFCNALLTVLNVVVLDGMGAGEIAVVLATGFLMGNIPTIVLLGIYFACREKKKRRAQLEKMNIQDLD